MSAGHIITTPSAAKHSLPESKSLSPPSSVSNSPELLPKLKPRNTLPLSMLTNDAILDRFKIVSIFNVKISPYLKKIDTLGNDDNDKIELAKSFLAEDKKLFDLIPDSQRGRRINIILAALKNNLQKYQDAKDDELGASVVFLNLINSVNSIKDFLQDEIDVLGDYLREKSANNRDKVERLFMAHLKPLSTAALQQVSLSPSIPSPRPSVGS